MFSNSSKYALKAVLYLALFSSEKKKIMVKDLSKPINVPQPYIAKLLQELSREKIISSTRGPKGGFYLSKSNRNQQVINIIYAIDGEKKINSCMLSLEHCNEEKPCPLHNLVNPYRTKTLKSLQNKTINDLCEEVKQGIAFLPL